MTGVPKLHECDRVLVVEGYSDLLFYAELLEDLGKHDKLFIKEVGGNSHFKEKLETLITPLVLASKQAIAVIADADTDAPAAATSLEAILSKLTGQTVKAGQWTNGKPRIGLFITPDGQTNGEIETLVWNAFAGEPANAPQKECVEGFKHCMATAGFKAKSHDKGLVSALLAIRSDEDPRLGPGARDGVFDFSRPEYLPLRTFLSGF